MTFLQQVSGVTEETQRHQLAEVGWVRGKQVSCRVSVGREWEGSWGSVWTKMQRLTVRYRLRSRVECRGADSSGGEEWRCTGKGQAQKVRGRGTVEGGCRKGGKFRVQDIRDAALCSQQFDWLLMVIRVEEVTELKPNFWITHSCTYCPWWWQAVQGRGRLKDSLRKVLMLKQCF